MADHDLCWLSATELARRVRTGALSPVDVAEAVVDRVERVDPELNALVHFDREQVLADARDLERAQRADAPLGPLHGVPYTIKDLTAVAGLPLTFGMVPLKDNVVDHDAPVVQRLRDAGGLFLGKTNTPESGYYGGTDNHLFGPTHNPWRHGYTAGGSSGGAAAAVAAGLGPLAEGSDGAGSVRIPSSLCGVVGHKPSLGRVPQTVLEGRFYTWAYHGPITRTVADVALMLDVLAGPTMADPMTLPAPPVPVRHSIVGDVRDWRVAWSPDLGLGNPVDPEVAEICARAVGVFEELGAQVTEGTPAWEPRADLALISDHRASPGARVLGEFVLHDRSWRRACAEPDAVLGWEDVPGYRDSYAAREVFRASGFAGGTSLLLRGPGGAAVGALHLSVAEPQLPGAVREALTVLRGSFAVLAGESAAVARWALSQRETQVLRLAAAGLTNAEIAAELVLARRTVATHVEHIIAKLGVRNRVQAASTAARLGLV